MTPAILADYALTTLDEACGQIGINVGDDDDAVIRCVNRASKRIASFCGRDLHYSSGIVEYVAGYATTDLMVSRLPIASVASIAFDGANIDANDYDLRDGASGVIYRRTGWIWTATLNPGVTQYPAPGTEEKLYAVTYAGGFWTPAQGPTSALPTGATLLPDDIEQAALELAAQTYRRRNGSGADVASESLMGYSVTYRDGVAADGAWTGGMPAEIAAMLAPYRSLLQST